MENISFQSSAVDGSEHFSKNIRLAGMRTRLCQATKGSDFFLNHTYRNFLNRHLRSGTPLLLERTQNGENISTQSLIVHRQPWETSRTAQGLLPVEADTGGGAYGSRHRSSWSGWAMSPASAYSLFTSAWSCARCCCRRRCLRTRPQWSAPTPVRFWLVGGITRYR